MSAHFDEIRSMLERFAAAWKENDGNAVGGFFTDDGTLINPFGERADGRSNVTAMYTKYFGSMLHGTRQRSTFSRSTMSKTITHSLTPSRPSPPRMATPF